MHTLIRLRPLEEFDAPNVQEQVSDCRIADTCGVPHPYPSDGAVTWTTKVIEEHKRGLRYPFAILFRNQFSGYIELELAGKPDGEAEIGYWISVDLWNCGIATEACRQIIAFGFEKVNLSFLTGSCLVRNPASGRVLEKNNFWETGTRTESNKQNKFFGERWRLFRLTKGQWERSRCEPPAEL